MYFYENPALFGKITLKLFFFVRFIYLNFSEEVLNSTPGWLDNKVGVWVLFIKREKFYGAYQKLSKIGHIHSASLKLSKINHIYCASPKRAKIYEIYTVPIPQGPKYAI